MTQRAGMPTTVSQPVSAVKHLHPTVVQYVNNEKIASEYDDYFRDNKLFRFDCTVLREELPAGGRILDAGCGSGRHLLFLEENGFEAHGLDLSAHFLNVARKKLRKHGYSSRLHQGDLLRPPEGMLPNGGLFDGVILMFSVLGMVRGAQSRLQALKTLGGLLRPGGRLIAHVHNRQYGTNVVLEKLQRLRGIFPQAQGLEEGDKILHNYRGIMDLYLHVFTRDELETLSMSAGLKVVRILNLTSERDGVCDSDVPAFRANGFILIAERA